MWLEVQISNKKKITDKTFYYLLSLEIQIKQANAYFGITPKLYKQNLIWFFHLKIMTPTLAFWNHHLHKKCGFILIMKIVNTYR